MTIFNDFINSILDSTNGQKDSFCINSIYYSYDDLRCYIAQIMTAINHVKDKNIALLASDDIRTYASIIAIWACGKAYVPLHLSQPLKRHQKVVKLLDTHVILSTDTSYEIELDEVNIIRTHEMTHKGYQLQKMIPTVEVDNTANAYIIFTSGSTGEPKGVPITRGNLCAFLESMDNIGMDITSEDRCLQPFDLTFDFSVSSYLFPLYKGACIYTIPDKEVKFTYIANLLEQYHLTVLQMVPSMIRNLLPYLKELNLLSIRYNILCGEALTTSVIIPWHEANPEMITYNMYGPTENTIFCTYYLIDKNNLKDLLHSNDIISIGTAFRRGNYILVTNSGEVITDNNVDAELCLYGDQLTPGYWSGENLNKFFELNGIRYYRSGDACFLDKSGNLMYRGRIDFQVKINGYRVELGEIESLFQHSAHKFCVVIPYKNKSNNLELAIIIEGYEYDYEMDKKFLVDRLPNYMVPSKWVFIDIMPLTLNGKIDRLTVKSMFNL